MCTDSHILFTKSCKRMLFPIGNSIAPVQQKHENVVKWLHWITWDVQPTLKLQDHSLLPQLPGSHYTKPRYTVGFTSIGLHMKFVIPLKFVWNQIENNWVETSRNENLNSIFRSCSKKWLKFVIDFGRLRFWAFGFSIAGFGDIEHTHHFSETSTPRRVYLRWNDRSPPIWFQGQSPFGGPFWASNSRNPWESWAMDNSS